MQHKIRAFVMYERTNSVEVANIGVDDMFTHNIDPSNGVTLGGQELDEFAAEPTSGTSDENMHG